MQRRQGPWAWCRLLDQSNLTPTGVPEQFEVTFSQGGRDVVALRVEGAAASGVDTQSSTVVDLPVPNSRLGPEDTLVIAGFDDDVETFGMMRLTTVGRRSGQPRVASMIVAHTSGEAGSHSRTAL